MEQQQPTEIEFNVNEDDFISKTSTSTSKKFRFQGKKIFITIPGYIGNEYIKFIQKKLGPILKYAYCNEIGDEKNKYEHSHIAIEFKNKIQLCDPRLIDYPVTTEKFEHPNISGIRKNWDACIQYLRKNVKKGAYFNSNLTQEELDKCENWVKKTKNEDTEFLARMVKDIENCKNANEAIGKYGADLKDVLPITTIFKNKTFDIQESYRQELLSTKLKNWQEHLKNMLTCEEPNDRNIIWICDQNGGAGKSMFTRVFRTSYPDNTIVLNSGGRISDISNIIRNEINKGLDLKYFMMDLPRTCEDNMSIYHILENIKDGSITCTKYDGRFLMFRPPHVVIFANWKPKYTKMSLDRWKIYNIFDDYIVEENINRTNILGYDQYDELESIIDQI